MGSRRGPRDRTSRQRFRAITDAHRRFRAFVHFDGRDMILDGISSPCDVSFPPAAAVLFVDPECDANGPSWLQAQFPDQRGCFKSGHDTCAIVLCTLSDVPGVDVT